MERIDTDHEVIWTVHPINSVIEAMVTNNLGFTPDRKRMFKEGTKSTLTLEDGREEQITGAERLNLHWHLNQLDNCHVLPLYSDRDWRLPALGKIEVNIIRMNG